MDDDIPAIDNRYRGATIDKSTTVDNRGATIINGPVIMDRSVHNKVETARSAPLIRAEPQHIEKYHMNPVESEFYHKAKLGLDERNDMHNPKTILITKIVIVKAIGVVLIIAASAVLVFAYNTPPTLMGSLETGQYYDNSLPKLLSKVGIALLAAGVGILIVCKIVCKFAQKYSVRKAW